MHLGKFVDLVKNTNWDDYFMGMFRQLGKLCQPQSSLKEVPEVPFTQAELIYKGYTVTKSDWISFAER